ncbi:thiosulfate oxidation carrier protein SoxY [uncultured Thiothrix sp.]|jgi:sulfur-oxidizing protein SoxY|uniref:thiosulfate oxidation carrier protein SoxY n=1 Tax=uncultured Thiothrix sp. TaxID=223185 RepID=UPI00260D4DCF|nr:thiosulfate oxidation carrier protein SoxY [uncultured Thiothrix sp.]HMT94396.1 thiosulfate oxidation carrier protein SoxY [Thiolinea sp.]
MKRRRFLSNTLAVSATGIAISSGLISPSLVFAAEEPNTNPFAAKTLDEVLKMINAVDAKPSTDVQIKAPEIAENGAVVPLTVSSSMEGVTGISIVVANNPTPLAATFTLPEGTKAEVSTRIKMAKTSEVMALVQTKDGLFSAKQEIKVTIGGCGG